MNCCCDCALPLTVKSSSITMVGSNMYITVPGIRFATMTNLQKLNVILCQSIPATAGTAQVFLSDGLTNVPVNVETGNFLRADQIKCRSMYRLIYGNNPVHFSLLCPVCRTAFVAPVTVASAPATVSENATTAKKSS